MPGASRATPPPAPRRARLAAPARMPPPCCRRRRCSTCCPAFSSRSPVHLAFALPLSKLERIGCRRRVQPLAIRLLARTLPRAFAAGLAWGWLPCGWSTARCSPRRSPAAPRKARSPWRPSAPARCPGCSPPRAAWPRRACGSGAGCKACAAPAESRSSPSALGPRPCRANPALSLGELRMKEAISILKSEHRSISAVLHALKELGRMAHDATARPRFQVPAQRCATSTSIPRSAPPEGGRAPVRAAAGARAGHARPGRGAAGRARGRRA